VDGEGVRMYCEGIARSSDRLTRYIVFILCAWLYLSYYGNTIEMSIVTIDFSVIVAVIAKCYNMNEVIIWR
jgi:hypothetical protein